MTAVSRRRLAPGSDEALVLEAMRGVPAHKTDDRKAVNRPGAMGDSALRGHGQGACGSVRDATVATTRK